MSNRDEQFKGFAKAVLNELVHTPNIDVDPLYDFELKEWQQILARAAYGLVYHALHEHQDSALYGVSTEQAVSVVPDMPVLPEEDAE